MNVTEFMFILGTILSVAPPVQHARTLSRDSSIRINKEATWRVFVVSDSNNNFLWHQTLWRLTEIPFYSLIVMTIIKIFINIFGLAQCTYCVLMFIGSVYFYVQLHGSLFWIQSIHFFKIKYDWIYFWRVKYTLIHVYNVISISKWLKLQKNVI